MISYLDPDEIRRVEAPPPGKYPKWKLTTMVSSTDKMYPA